MRLHDGRRDAESEGTMKTMHNVEQLENFCDDRPVSARDWQRIAPAPKLTIQEVRTAGIIGLLLFIVGLPALVIAFCYF
jgi:hypothetical protein